MQKWEYKAVSYFFDNEKLDWYWHDGTTADKMTLWDKLNQLGDDGWEYIETKKMDKLVQVYLFKRPKE